MSGLYGHIHHLYDNPKMTFGEMKNILMKAEKGQLIDIHEKTDGQNVFFTFDFEKNCLLFARNKTNIKQGGMTFEDISNKWKELPKVQNGYKESYQILFTAFSSLSKTRLRKIFGNKRKVWFSAEIIFDGNPNVIFYNRNVVVIHRSGVVYSENGTPNLKHNTNSNYSALLQNLTKANESISNSSWEIWPPVEVRPRCSAATLGTAIHSLIELQSIYSLEEENTVEDFIAAKFYEDILDKLDIENKKEIAKIYALDEQIRIRKRLLKDVVADKEIHKALGKYISNHVSLNRGYVEPLEEIIHDFSVGLLENTQSKIAKDPYEEVKRLQESVKKEIKKIKLAGNKKELQILAKHLRKLKHPSKITSSMEGITFRHNDVVYKLTGNFSPINGIMGLFRYKKHT